MKWILSNFFLFILEYYYCSYFFTMKPIIITEDINFFYWNVIKAKNRPNNRFTLVHRIHIQMRIRVPHSYIAGMKNKKEKRLKENQIDKQVKTFEPFYFLFFVQNASKSNAGYQIQRNAKGIDNPNAQNNRWMRKELRQHIFKQ